MVRMITSLILSPRKDNLLIICLVLGFLIMVTGSWLSGQQNELSQQQESEIWHPATPSDFDGDDEKDMQIYATAP